MNEKCIWKKFRVIKAPHFVSWLPTIGEVLRLRMIFQDFFHFSSLCLDNYRKKNPPQHRYGLVQINSFETLVDDVGTMKIFTIKDKQTVCLIQFSSLLYFKGIKICNPFLIFNFSSFSHRRLKFQRNFICNKPYATVHSYF